MLTTLKDKYGKGVSAYNAKGGNEAGMKKKTGPEDEEEDEDKDEELMAVL